MRTKIISLEEIAKSFSGRTLQEKIKRYIYVMHVNNCLKYVMLGGDDTIVPVRGCYSQMEITKNVNKKDTIIDKTIPCDLYYACFGGDFSWNANGNHLYGETDDNIDFTPSVFVTRLPVRTRRDVENYVCKLLEYEQDPLSKGWEAKFLSFGGKLYGFKNGHSDSEIMADDFYSQYLKGKWNGNWHKFFDTGNNLPPSIYASTGGDLQKLLSEGYPFVDEISYGAQYGWFIDSIGGYSFYGARSLKNKGFSIITTMSCQTNAFDNSEEAGANDPCLSEAFIRNPESGVLAYLGCSRFGVVGKGFGNRLSYSMLYNALYYEALFSNSFKYKNFGVLVAEAKSRMINFCKGYNPNRWIQLGLNPVGDPEMPIYTECPREFKNASIKILGNNKIEVVPGVGDATICVMSPNDNGEKYYKVVRGEEKAVFSELPSSFTVCITKYNYVPKVEMYRTEHIQNELISSSAVFLGNAVYVGSSVTSAKPSGPVYINSPSMVIRSGHIVMEPDIYVSRDSNLKLNNN